MGGAIIQLIAYGAQNIYLTGDPQITFWKTVYKRYTNFATESIQQDIIGNLAPGNYVSVTIARNGDLLKGLTLQYNPSQIYNGNFVLYSNGDTPSNLGNTIFKQMEIEIGGNLIDRHYGLWLTIWSNLTIQSYIAPAQSADNFLIYVYPLGAEPTVCNQYARMSYNHNQVNTYQDYQFKMCFLYSNPDPNKFRGTIAYHVAAPTTVPTVGTFNLSIANINELVTFDNPLNVIFLYYGPTIPSASAPYNYFIQFSGVTNTLGVTTFSGCQPYSPTPYPAVATPVGLEYSVCNVFEVYSGPLNPADVSPAGITNIIPTSLNTSFNLRVNNPTALLLYGTKGTLTIYSGGQYYNIEYGSPSGKNKYFVAEGYSLIYDCEVLYTAPGAPVVLASPDLIVPTGTYFVINPINDLLYIDYLINLLPTGGPCDVIASSPIDIVGRLLIDGPLPPNQSLETVFIDGYGYGLADFFYVGSSFYSPVTQLYYYLGVNTFSINGYPSVPTPLVDGTYVYHGFLASGTAAAPTEAYVPLQFWFCRNPGLALPLIALQYHEVKLNLLLATWQELHAASYAEINYSSIKVYAEYVYLDSNERRKFTNNAHEYLIDQLQFDTFNNSFANNVSGGQLQININFSNCVKELVFCGTPLAYGVYTQGIGTPNKILNKPAETSNVQLQLKFNQGNRFSNRNLKYFTRNQIWDCHTGSGSCNALTGDIGTDSIGVYSFALRPEEHQPSGTCNFSRISKPQLVFSNFDSANGEQINSLNIYAVNYNILRIMSGMGNVAYAY
jgi:Large eukaryotic DNA virus major capsid protein/Major capsid protein N-terminus